MRPKARIDICFRLGRKVDGFFDYKAGRKHIKEIKKKWKEEPDFRFGQLLEVLGLSHLTEMNWWEEESTFLYNRGIPLEEVSFWGSIYTPKGNLRKGVKFTLLKDLTDQHIENILASDTTTNKLYLEYFKKRLSNK